MLPLELLSPDLQRLYRMVEYCTDIGRAIVYFGNSFEDFQANTFYQYAVSFCLFQIGELSGGLSEGFRLSIGKNIPWRTIKAMRNIVAHGYDSIRLDIVWDTALHDIPALKAFCEEELAKARQE